MGGIGFSPVLQQQMFQAQQNDLRFNGAAALGARDGSLNRNEFIALAGEANEITALRARYAEGGVSTFEQAILDARTQRYDHMYQAFRHGDYHPQFNPANPLVARQLSQAGRIYDGIQDGSLTGGESVNLLREQRGVAHQAGVGLRDGYLNFFERAALSDRLDHSSGHIFSARHNWHRTTPRWW